MPNISSIIKAIVKAAEKPSALPDIAERGTAAAPKVLEAAMKSPGRVAQRATSVPFHGAPETQTHVRSTEAPGHEMVEVPGVGAVDDPVGTVKNFFKGFIMAEPEVTPSAMRPSDLGEKIYKAKWRNEISGEVADRDVATLLDPIKSDHVAKAALLSDYMVTLDEVAQAAANGKDTIRGIPVAVWKASVNQLDKKVKADPEVAAAFNNVRTHLDSMFEEMVNRGWITADRKLSDYTPIMKLNASLDGLAHFTGEGTQAMRDRLLSAQRARGKSATVRETDLIQLLRSHRAEYLSKVAQHEGFMDILADQTVNFTDKFHGQSDIPQDLAVYRNDQGGFGSTAKTADGRLLDAYGKALDPKGKIPVAGYVLPKKLVKALHEFDRRQLHGSEKDVQLAQSALSKWLTVYNPANTFINRVGDSLTAMFFPHEGKAHPLGILRFMAEGDAAGMKLAKNKGPHMYTLHGRTVDLTDLAVREGLTTSTIHHLVGGERMPAGLAKFSEGGDEAMKAWEGNLLSKMEAERLGVELAPRIAAGLEAVERTGDWSQFGKVGRDITFRYGAGSPRASQLPILKAMAPFLQFQGLATQRMLHTWGAKGMDGKARILLGVIAVPMAINSWNTQNDAYQQAENSLPAYERSQQHIWMPGPDPAKPRLDVEGKPVAIRTRFLMPEAVAGMFGLGNAAPRVGRVISGRDTPIQFARETATGAAETVAGSLVIPQMIQQLVGADRSQPGKGIEERVERAAPLVRVAGETIRATKNYGLQEGTIKFLQGITGMRAATVRTKGRALLDSQFMEAKAKMTRAVKAVRTYSVGDPEKLKQAIAQRDEAQKELIRLQQILKAEKAAGYEQAPPDSAPTRAMQINEQIFEEDAARRRQQELEDEEGSE